MKILMLTPYLPYPLMSGGQTRSYNLIKNLSKKHEITLFSLIKDESEKEHIKELEKLCTKVRVFKRSKTPWTFRNILRTGFGSYPFLVIRNLSGEERRAVKEELSKEKYDLIHAETFYVMPHIPSTHIPILLVEQTVEYLVYKHYVEKQAKFWLRPLLRIDLLKIKFWEKYYWKQADRVVAMSESDRNTMRELLPGLDIDIVPNGIDIDHFSNKKVEKAKVPTILYVGNFTWLQNIEAVDALYSKVWPIIKNSIPNARLWIVGNNMTPKIKSMDQEKDIEITERIPDIRDAYKRANVLVTPIKGPGGTRLKILEAMASGLPVVTTSVGAEGLNIKDDKQAIIKDNYEVLGEEAVKVLTNKALAQRLGKEGQRFVEENYTWNVSSKILDDIYTKTRKKNSK